MVEVQTEKPFMYSHFVEGILSGKLHRLSANEIEKIITRNHFGFTPLTSLKKEEEQLLLVLAKQCLHQSLNHENLASLCGPVFYDGETFYLDGSEKMYLFRKITDREAYLLLPEEKRKLFFDPSVWHRKRLQMPGVNTGLTRYGNRNLVTGGDGYFANENEFRKLINKIKRQSGKERLVVLDIGCGMGKALQDMKDFYPELETHGVTMEPEPAMFRADYFHYIAAERMPAEFEGKFHLITSNMAFRYFLFQHIALLNVVKALANGGHAELHFSYDRVAELPGSRSYFLEQVPGSQSNYDAMKVLVKRTVTELENLQKKGKIKIITSSNFYEQHMQGGITIEKINN